MTTTEAEEGLLPQEPLCPGERVLTAGSVELKRVVMDLESRPHENSVTDLESRREPKQKPTKG